MDYKKSSAAQDCITRNIQNFDQATGNLYETVAILSKRANQISVDIKEELNSKLAEYARTAYADNAEEVFENREQIEVAKYFETIPKPTLIATQELVDGKIYFRDPALEQELGEE